MTSVDSRPRMLSHPERAGKFSHLSKGSSPPEKTIIGKKNDNVILVYLQSHAFACVNKLQVVIVSRFNPDFNGSNMYQCEWVMK